MYPITRPIIDDIEGTFDRLFNGGLRSLGFGSANSNGNGAQQSLPLDVSETEKEFVIRASLPGFSRDNVNIEMMDGILTISAEWGDVQKEEGEKEYLKECRYSSMSRSLTLPAAAQDGDVNAVLKDGVLTIRVPKADDAKPKKIKVK